MQHKLLNIHSHPLTSYLLHNAFTLQNDQQVEECFIIPKGTIGINAVLHGDCTYVYDKCRLNLPKVWVFGLINKPLHSVLSTNYKAIGFRFKPEFFQLIMKKKIPDLKNQAIDLTDMISPYEAEYLLDGLRNAGNEFSIMEVFNRFLHRNLHNEKIDKRVEYSLARIRNGDTFNIETLSRELNITSTTLRNLFSNNVGTTPKELIRIYRLQRALKASTINYKNLTKLAYSLGYFDQSHFIHDFKDAFGITPLKYFSNQKLTYDFQHFDRWRLDSF